MRHACVACCSQPEHQCVSLVRVQGSEAAARKRVPADMAPPWKVGRCPHNAHVMQPCIYKALAHESNSQMIIDLLSNYEPKLYDGIQQQLLLMLVDSNMYIIKHITMCTYVIQSKCNNQA